MIALIQRVTHSSVKAGDVCLGAIDTGVLALIGIQRNDSEATAGRLLERILNYRIFPDAQGRMNESLRTIGGGLLLVPQFTLAADTRKGTRPSFTPAEAPQKAERLFDRLVELAREAHSEVSAGRFGADMAVQLVNDGPVTFWLEVSPKDRCDG